MTPDPEAPLPPVRAGLMRTGIRLLALFALAFGVHLFLDWLMNWTEGLDPDRAAMLRVSVLAAILLAYVLLIAIPFVPGIEIGLSLILLRGAEVAILVYLATAAGLILAYFAGRWLPYPWLRRVFEDLHMRRAAAMLERIEPLTPERRLAYLRRHLPGRLGTWAVHYRYLLLAALINMPGSFLIGGGGGICMVAGLTRLFRLRATILTIALAVLPFPLAVWFWGPGILS